MYLVEVFGRMQSGCSIFCPVGALSLLSSTFDLKMFGREKTFETLAIINARRSQAQVGSV